MDHLSNTVSIYQGGSLRRRVLEIVALLMTKKNWEISSLEMFLLPTCEIVLFLFQYDFMKLLHAVSGDLYKLSTELVYLKEKQIDI